MRTIDISSREHYKNAVYNSPFHSRQARHNQMKEWSRWGDYQSVPAYWCVDMEYFAGRNACGVFDLTPMVKHDIRGPDAQAYLDRLQWLLDNVEGARARAERLSAACGAQVSILSART